jgi:hypothetical protein
MVGLDLGGAVGDGSAKTGRQFNRELSAVGREWSVNNDGARSQAPARRRSRLTTSY